MYMDACTIRLRRNTKSRLDRYREYRNESYDEVVLKIVGIADSCGSDPELSRDAVQRIEKARRRIRAGGYVTEKEARKRLGL